MFLLWRPFPHKHIPCIPGAVKKQAPVADFEIPSHDHLISQILSAVGSIPFPHLLDRGLIDIHAYQTENIGGRVGSLQCLKSHFSTFCRRGNDRSSDRRSPSKIIGIGDFGNISSFSGFGGNQDHPPCSPSRSEEHTSELQSRENLVCR